MQQILNTSNTQSCRTAHSFLIFKIVLRKEKLHIFDFRKGYPQCSVDTEVCSILIHVYISYKFWKLH